MLVKEAKKIIGSLGHPSKMPGLSYGLPASQCNVGSKLAKIPGTTCYNCYAMKGNYIYRDVKTSHANRLKGIESSLWVAAMVMMIERSGEQWFRWHDSGDIQSAEHLQKIIDIARRLPNVRFWLPTREYQLVKSFNKPIPRNLTIRISATKIDGAAPTFWRTTSTVHNNKPATGYVCPAPTQGNKCNDCRACWSKIRNVSYHVH